MRRLHLREVNGKAGWSGLFCCSVLSEDLTAAVGRRVGQELTRAHPRGEAAVKEHQAARAVAHVGACARILLRAWCGYARRHKLDPVAASERNQSHGQKDRDHGIVELGRHGAYPSPRRISWRPGIS